MITGGCYCGAVKYEIHGKVLMFANCHCPDCRKFTGAAYAPVLAVEAEGFKVAGEDQLIHYPSSPGKQRSFCKHCGCHLYLRAEHRPNLVFIRAGTLDDNPQMAPQSHFWTSVKAPWHTITDDLPQYTEGLSK